MRKKTNPRKTRRNAGGFSFKNVFLGMAESFVKHFWGNFIGEISEKIEKFKRKLKLLFFSWIFFGLGVVFLLTSLVVYLSSLLGFAETFLLMGLALVLISGILLLLADKD